MPSLYTPLYAEKPPSTGTTIPVTKPLASSLDSQSSVPVRSSTVPKRFSGGAEYLVCPRGGFPFRRAGSVLIGHENPGAMLTLMLQGQSAPPLRKLTRPPCRAVGGYLVGPECVHRRNVYNVSAACSRPFLCKTRSPEMLKEC